jgi:hypothetical protein
MVVRNKFVDMLHDRQVTQLLHVTQVSNLPGCRDARTIAPRSPDISGLG